MIPLLYLFIPTKLLYCAAPSCTPDTLTLYNGRKTCSAGPGGQGYICNITCETNHVFFEDVHLDSVSLSCVPGGVWNRPEPICTGELK